jgi:hypothetical protein
MPARPSQLGADGFRHLVGTDHALGSTGDIALIAEQALIGTALMGNEDGDDKGRKHGIRRKAL